jgi:uncharacterized protein (TIGR03905 family)
MYEYTPSGVCSKDIQFDIIGEKVTNVRFAGGCNGNLSGISTLVEGMRVDELIDKLSGITCGGRNTSCPDQLTKALLSYKKAI